MQKSSNFLFLCNCNCGPNSSEGLFFLPVGLKITHHFHTQIHAGTVINTSFNKERNQ
uniref:Uncharacterized protein n=1 Tax=Anguilla anguilla TaxID=7936 RepID=A0A0E9SI05_ANGAN